MQRRLASLVVAAVAGCFALGGCVVAPPRARVVAVVPARIWIPAHVNHQGVWVAGYWRYR